MFNANNLPLIEEWSPDYEAGQIEGILNICWHGNANTAACTKEPYNSNTLAFIVDARIALEVQQKLGWYAKMDRYDRWLVYEQNGAWIVDLQVMQEKDWKNPFTAIAEAYVLAQQKGQDCSV